MEHSCTKVVIINNGEIVAVDSVANLHGRRSGPETVLIEVAGADSYAVRQRLEQVAGVAKVVSREGRDGAAAFEIHGLANQEVRPELARAIVQSGWNLTELRAVGESLEEIFLELTKSEKTKESGVVTE